MRISRSIERSHRLLSAEPCTPQLDDNDGALALKLFVKLVMTNLNHNLSVKIIQFSFITNRLSYTFGDPSLIPNPF